jgi:hypothetical protein
MNKTAIKFNGIISSISSKIDGSLGLRLSTPELNTKEKIAILELQGINTEVYLKPLEDEIIDAIVVDKDLEQKTASQRLRSILYLLWKRKGEKEDFAIYYKNKMEYIIERIKQRLDE